MLEKSLKYPCFQLRGLQAANNLPKSIVINSNQLE